MTDKYRESNMREIDKVLDYMEREKKNHLTMYEAITKSKILLEQVVEDIDNYTDEDLDNMVENFRSMGMYPPGD